MTNDDDPASAKVRESDSPARLTRERRRDLVAQRRARGDSTSAIARELDLHHTTVRADVLALEAARA